MKTFTNFTVAILAITSIFATLLPSIHADDTVIEDPVDACTNYEDLIMTELAPFIEAAALPADVGGLRGRDLSRAPFECMWYCRGFKVGFCHRVYKMCRDMRRSLQANNDHEVIDMGYDDQDQTNDGAYVATCNEAMMALQAKWLEVATTKVDDPECTAILVEAYTESKCPEKDGAN